MAKKKKQKKKRRGVLKGILLGLFFLFLIGLAAGAVLLYIAASKAPEISLVDVEPDGYRTSILDAEGNVALSLSGQESNRVYVKLDEIPKDVQNAFIAIEDSRFYSHRGIDPIGIGRALWRGIKNGGVTEGGSTITQQLIKNNVFTKWASGETFEEKVERKLQEQILAIRLENTVDKNWILENYLNTINLGGGNWGVWTAASYYFHKDVSELTLSEAAVLAAIAKNPTQYNPRLHPENNEGRRKIVLDYMLAQEMISAAAHEEALSDDVYARIAEAESGTNLNEVFNYFEDALVEALIRDFQKELSMSEEEAWDLLYRGGLTVHGTEDQRMQEICETLANDPAIVTTDAEISMVIIDPASGEVRALLGGRGKKEASLLYNRATSSVRQPGSAIKAIGEYAKALEAGKITLGTAVDDAPYAYSDGSSIGNANGTYGGMTTIRQAIAESNNVVALKTLQSVGTDEVLRQLSAFGITTLSDADAHEALALGGTTNGVTNLEMTAAYAAIAAGGVYREPIYYTKVLDHDGHILLEKKQRSHQAVSAETAQLLTSAMEDVLLSGTGQNAYFDGPQLAGKSGTTTGIRDAWFVGFTPALSLGVWGGYDDNKEQQDSEYVKVLWRQAMQAACNGETTGFSDDGLIKVKICTKCGKLAVADLCDQTVQGDMTREELYQSGTEPTENCDCHIKVQLCKESHMRATRYCEETEELVYLKHASDGTSDQSFVLPAQLASDTCTQHRSFWNQWFSQPAVTETPTPMPEEEVLPQPDESTMTPTPVPEDETTPETDGNEETEETSPNWWEREFWESLFGT